MIKEKNWLIRTSNFQILGPVSKQKILEFVEKGSLKGEDEITSGNGYWFLIKEKDLLEKYVLGDIPQTFNPITEAPNVLTANQSPDHTGTHNKIPLSKPSAKKPKSADESDINLPDDGDLEYPDMNLPAGDDLEYPDLGEPSGSLDVESLEVRPTAAPAAKPVEPEVRSSEDDIEGLLPEDSDLEYPDMGELLGTSPNEDEVIDDFDEETDPNIAISEFDEETDPGIIPEEMIEVEEVPESTKPEPVPPARTPIPAASKKLAVKHKPIEEVEEAEPEPEKKKSKKAKKPQRNDKLLFVLTALFFVALLLVAVIFYYKKILNKPIPFIGSSAIEWVLPSANAQTGLVESLIKKKTFLIFKI